MQESNRIEYKSALTDRLEREVVAFLNYHEGGIIYIGIDDSGEAVGVDDADKMQLKIIDRIKNNILPNALGLFDVILEQHGDKNIIKIVISSGTEKPFYIKQQGMSPSGCYLRVGSSAQQMTTTMIDDMYARRVRNTLATTPSPRHHLTFEQLMIYYQAKGLHLNNSFKQSLELLLENGKHNYLAYLLADENGVSIKVAKYSGTNKVDLIENYEFGYCSIIKATKSVIQKMEIENKIFTQITSSTRKERQMVNGVALREAIINAVVHNDYSLEVPPVVEIYSDRITVTSYGGLLPAMSKDDFIRGCSMPRNRELMRVFKDVELVEQLGSGMNRIMEVYDESIFEFRPNFLIVTFPFDKEFITPNGIVNGAITGVINDEQTEAQVILAIKENPKITITVMAQLTGIPRRTVERELKKLKSDGKIKRIGSNKAGHWEILE